MKENEKNNDYSRPVLVIRKFNNHFEGMNGVLRRVWYLELTQPPSDEGGACT